MQDAHPDHHLPFGGELHGVGTEVEQDLPDPGAVPEERRRNVRLDVDQELDPFGVGGARQDPPDVVDDAGQVERGLLDLELAGLDLREVEDVVDDHQQALRRQLDAGSELRLLLVEIGLEQEIGEPDDAVHRRPDLVAHGGDELGLRPRGDQGRISSRDEVLRHLPCLGHVATVEDVPVDRRVVEEVGGRPVDDPPVPVRLTHAHLEDSRVGMVVGQPGEVFDDRAGVVGVHEVGERPALEFVWRVPEHAAALRA